MHTEKTSLTTKNCIGTLVAGFLAASVVAHAAPVTYVLNVTTTGDLGTTAILNKLVTITGVGDTANVVPITGGYCNPLTNASFAISGGFSGTITEPLIAVTNGTSAGFQGGTCASPTPSSVAIAGAFSGFQLASSIGPVAGTPSTGTHNWFNTGLGLLSLSLVSTPADYSATVAAAAATPVPTPTLQGSALTGLSALIAIAGALLYRSRCRFPASGESRTDILRPATSIVKRKE